MATSNSNYLIRLALLGLGSLTMSACADGKASKAPSEPPAGRFAIVQVDGLEPGTRETLTIDTATGSTWRLVKSTAPGSHDDIGWHPIPDLTIESRTPYYRSRPNSGTDGQGANEP
jgi:hypothetical protein